MITSCPTFRYLLQQNLNLRSMEQVIAEPKHNHNKFWNVFPSSSWSCGKELWFAFWHVFGFGITLWFSQVPWSLFEMVMIHENSNFFILEWFLRIHRHWLIWTTIENRKTHSNVQVLNCHKFESFSYPNNTQFQDYFKWIMRTFSNDTVQILPRFGEPRTAAI